MNKTKEKILAVVKDEVDICNRNYTRAFDHYFSLAGKVSKRTKAYTAAVEEWRQSCSWLIEAQSILAKIELLDV